MIEWVEVSLTGRYRSGKVLPDSQFLDKLSTGSMEVDPSRGPWETARVILLRAKYEDFRGSITAADEFALYVEEKLSRAAQWLSKQPVELFREFTNGGIILTAFVDLWIDQNQMDITLPASFLHECGIRGVPIRTYTNE